MNKGYIDELYDGATRATDQGAVGPWPLEGGRRVIDGAVNGTGAIVLEGGAVARAIQTGSMRTYAVVGAVWSCAYGWLLPVDVMPLLTLLVATPLAGLAILAMIDSRRDALIRRVALAVSLAVFALTLLLWARFDPASADFQFTERYAWIPAFGVEYFVGSRRHQSVSGRA